MSGSVKCVLFVTMVTLSAAHSPVSYELCINLSSWYMVIGRDNWDILLTSLYCATCHFSNHGYLPLLLPWLQCHSCYHGYSATLVTMVTVLLLLPWLQCHSCYHSYLPLLLPWLLATLLSRTRITNSLGRCRRKLLECSFQD